MFGKKLFAKKERGKTTEYKVESENLAVPEIHTHNIHSETMNQLLMKM